MSSEAKTLNKRQWIGRNTLIELLKDVPAEAQIAVSRNGNLTFYTDKVSGYIDFTEECVETVPDHL
jgi:hypothetical protein